MKKCIKFIIFTVIFSVNSYAAANPKNYTEEKITSSLDRLIDPIDITTNKGKTEIYDSDEKLIASGLVKKKMMSGEWTFYSNEDDSSKVTLTGTFRNGQKNGRFKLFYPNGRVKWKLFYRNGTLNGPMYVFAKNGIPKYEIWFKKGKKNGIYREYFPDGKPKEISRYQNDIKNGTENLYSPKGKRVSMGKYKNGKKDGLWSYRYDTGVPKAKGYFKNGKKVKSWKYYDENGKLIENK